MKDSTRVGNLFVRVDISANGDHCLEMLWLNACSGVLRDSIIRHAPCSNFPVRPSLCPSPLDGVMECLGAGVAPDSQLAGTFAGPWSIYSDDSVAFGNPHCGVDRLVILVNLSFGIPVKVVILPLLVFLQIVIAANQIVVECFAVDAAIEDRGILAIGLGEENITTRMIRFPAVSGRLESAVFLSRYVAAHSEPQLASTILETYRP